MTQRPALAVAAPPQSLIPPCVMGTAFSTSQNDCVVLRHMAHAQVPATPLSSVADCQLGVMLCRFRAVFSVTLNGYDNLAVECLAPLGRVWQHQEASSFIVVQEVDVCGAPSRLAALSLAFVRDCFLGCGVETLQEACARSQWSVGREELQTWFI